MTPSRAARFTAIVFVFSFLSLSFRGLAQDLPPRYPTLELFTNTPCPICGSQNPGMFARLQNYEGQYHLISFYPGKPYPTCIFYKANIPENTTRWQFYPGHLFGTPTVAINGLNFTNSAGVTNALLNSITGGTSWLSVNVEETPGPDRTVDITLTDHVGGSLTTGRLFAVIVEKEIQYNAPNGETLHHHVFRRFLGPVGGEDVDLTSGTASKSYTYSVDASWEADQVYVIAWLMDPSTKEIYNSGTRFDPDFVSAVDDPLTEDPLEVVPNPASSQFRITLPDRVEEAALRIYDAAGKLVYQDDSFGRESSSIDCASWPSGLYFLRLHAEGRQRSGSISIDR